MRDKLGSRPEIRKLCKDNLQPAFFPISSRNAIRLFCHAHEGVGSEEVDDARLVGLKEVGDVESDAVGSNWKAGEMEAMEAGVELYAARH